MATSICRFCGVKDTVANLVEVCQCHKKTDSALCHVSCLENYIEKRRQSGRDSVSDSAAQCPNCQQEFRVKVRWKWSTDRYFSATSMGQYFNLTMIVVSSIGFFFAMYRSLNSENPGPNEKKILLGMLLLVLVMTIIVIVVLCKRCYRHQQNAELVEIV